LPAIWRAAAADPADGDVPDAPPGPLRAPSSASWTPTAFGQNQRPLLPKAVDGCESASAEDDGWVRICFCRRRRSVACPRSGAQRQQTLLMEMCLMRRRASGLGAAARPIVSKLDSYGLRPESKAASAEGRGWMRICFCRRRRSVACPRSGAQRQQTLLMEMCLMRRRASSLGAAARPIVSKLDSYGLRPESKAASAEGRGWVRICFCRRPGMDANLLLPKA